MIESDNGVESFMVDEYSDMLHASFIYKGDRLTQLYPLGTDRSKMEEDAVAYISRRKAFRST